MIFGWHHRIVLQKIHLLMIIQVLQCIIMNIHAVVTSYRAGIIVAISINYAALFSSNSALLVMIRLYKFVTLSPSRYHIATDLLFNLTFKLTININYIIVSYRIYKFVKPLCKFHAELIKCHNRMYKFVTFKLHVTRLVKTQHNDAFLDIQIFVQAIASSICLKLCSVVLSMLYCKYVSSYKAR